VVGYDNGSGFAPVIEFDGVRVFQGDCREVLKGLLDNSVDSIVTDPPYGLSNTSPELVSKTLVRWISGERDFIPDGAGFMGKDWDAFVPPPAVWDECLRVLKPGGHLLAFFGSRTMDLGQLAIRLAGFEIRDSVAWIYGSGFPKSLDVSKAIDKAAGIWRGKAGEISSPNGSMSGGNYERTDKGNPVTDHAIEWQGWGTALKPAHEPIVVARKPLEGTVAANVLEWGTGGLNIDGSRIGTETIVSRGGRKQGVTGDEREGAALGMYGAHEPLNTKHQGRWPANVVFDEYTAGLLDEQSGVTKSTGGRIGKKDISNIDFGLSGKYEKGDPGFGDTGGASRFFYVAKASKRDRNEGLEDLEERHAPKMDGGPFVSPTGNDSTLVKSRNFHPTVKPTALMRYLVKLVTPPGGVVLDPFTGSGSTGKAAILEGFQFVGAELTEDYLPIIEGRLKWALENRESDDTLF
jgi:DNA modification methylase